MLNNKKSTIVSISVCYFIGAVLLFFTFFGVRVFVSYMTDFRGYDAAVIESLKRVFILCFYPCDAFAGVILFGLLRLLYNIRNDKVFVLQNVNCLELVSWCCFAITLITLVGGIYYMPFWFVSAAAGFVGMLLRVLKNVLHAAVKISQENALTI